MGLVKYLHLIPGKKDVQEVLYRFISNIFVRIRPYLPRRGYITWSGVKVGERKWLDPVIGLMASDNPDHEELVISYIRKYVSSGETVVEIGGGSGVSAVIAANQVGKSGRVITFEASENMVELIENTVRLNGVGDTVTVKYAVVSKPVRIMKRDEGDSLPNTVEVDDIPKCDTIILDCDGCEFDVLNKISDLPPTIIVEHHAVLDRDDQIIDYCPSKLRNTLGELGYNIIDGKSKKMAEVLQHKFGDEETVFIGKL